MRVAATALANLAATAPNRDKIATRHCAAQLLALAQLEVVPVARAALRCVSNVALHTGTKEELLAEGALQLLLQLFGDTLGVEAGSPRMRTLQLGRALHTRRLALQSLANLCESHLAVQARAEPMHAPTPRAAIRPRPRLLSHPVALAPNPLRDTGLG